MALLFSLGTFLVVGALHSAWCRVGWSRNRVISFLMVSFPGGIFMVSCLWLMAQPRIEILSSILVYALFCELYVFLFTLALGSISANLLLALRGKSLTWTALDEVYDGGKMVGQRLARLEQLGLICRVDNAMMVTAAGLSVRSRWSALRKLFRHTTLDD